MFESFDSGTTYNVRVIIKRNPLHNVQVLCSKKDVQYVNNYQRESMALCFSFLVQDNIQLIIKGNLLLHDCMPWTKDNIWRLNMYQKESTA